MSLQATEGRVLVTASVSSWTRDRLIQHARQNERSLSAEIRRALAAYVEAECLEPHERAS